MSPYTKRFLTSTALLLSMVASWSIPAAAQEAINVYGPGGPAPAMEEAAKAFAVANQVSVNVAARPTSQWIDKATAGVNSGHYLTRYLLRASSSQSLT